MKKIFLIILMPVICLYSCDFLDSIFSDSYYTDFSSDSGDFIFDTESETSDISEISDGVLHLRSTVYSGFDAGAQARYTREITVNSGVSFKVKFGEYFNTQHPMGHFNLLYRSADERINIMLSSGGIDYFTVIDGTELDRHLADMTINQDQWYELKFVLKPMWTEVYLDNVRAGYAESPDGLPEQGYFIFECHNEYWIDDFSYVPES